MYAWSCSLCEGGTSFCTGLIFRKLGWFLLMFLTGFTSFSVLHLFPLSITFFTFVQFFILFHLCWIKPSANAFVFRNFNILQKDVLTYSGGTDRSGEICYSFSVSNELTQMVNFPSWIPDCDSHSPAFFGFISFFGH